MLYVCWMYILKHYCLLYWHIKIQRKVYGSSLKLNNKTARTTHQQEKKRNGNDRKYIICRELEEKQTRHLYLVEVYYRARHFRFEIIYRGTNCVCNIQSSFTILIICSSFIKYTVAKKLTCKDHKENWQQVIVGWPTFRTERVE